ncbi:PLDc N-terminal domain-containing protein [Myroides odoratus]|uniref:PLDc N-terminal domain-containing protein n=1 Tax=Myroides odoratus TaxID=256 RepID=UPI0039B1210B
MKIYIWQLFLISLFLFTIYALYRVSKSNYTLNKKLIFCFIILLFPLLGGIFFLMINQNNKN